jgi:hypothetical protein
MIGSRERLSSNASHADVSTIQYDIPAHNVKLAAWKAAPHEEPSEAVRIALLLELRTFHLVARVGASRASTRS